MCCTRLVKNTGRKNDAKNRHLSTIAQLCWAISSQARHVSTNEKNMLNSNISTTYPHNMANIGPLAAEIVSTVWSTPAYFNGFRVLLRYCTDVAERRSTKLCTVFGRLLGCYIIYLPPDGIVPRAKIHFTSKSCVLLHWHRHCTAIQQRASANVCGVQQRVPHIFGRAAITFGIGPHSSSFFFSSPILSGRRLDVYHTSTHGVALVRILNAGLKCAARGSLKIQDVKMTQKIVICAPSHNFVGLQLRN